LKLILPDEDALPTIADVKQTADTPLVGTENSKFPTVIACHFDGQLAFCKK
jgi:hypothetical protein